MEQQVSGSAELPKCEECVPCEDCPTWKSHSLWTRYGPTVKWYAGLSAFVIVIAFVFFCLGQDNPKPGATLTSTEVRETIAELEHERDFYKDIVVDSESGGRSVTTAKWYPDIKVPLGTKTRIPGTNLLVDAWMPEGRAELYRLRARVTKVNPLQKVIDNPWETLPFKAELGNNFWDDEADCPMVIVDDQFILHVERLLRRTDQTGDEELTAVITLIDLSTNVGFDYQY